MNILRLISAILLIGTGIILTLALLFSNDPWAVKILLVVLLGVIPIKIGLKLIKTYNARSTGIQPQPEPNQVNDTTNLPVASPGNFLMRGSAKLAAALTPKDDFGHIKKKKKLYRNVSYKGGFPNIGTGFAKSFDIAVAKEGLLFMVPFSSKIVVCIPWQHLVGIVSSKQMSQTGQSFLTGMSVNMRTTGDAVAAGVFASFLEKNPLIFQYRLNDRDSFIQEASFNDSRGNKIKAKIMSKRATLYSPAHPIQPAPVNAPDKDSFDQLKKLAELRDQKIISEEEFSRKKEQLLGLV